MKDYIYLTLDALRELINENICRSAEFAESEPFINILRTQSTDNWQHSKIRVHTTQRGLFIYTPKLDNRHGLLFDLTTFRGFDANHNDDEIIMIFQNVMKFAIRKFDGEPLIGRERYFAENNSYVVFPMPFVAKKSAPKVLIHYDEEYASKKNVQYLTAYYYSTDSLGVFNPANTNKAIEDFKKESFDTSISKHVQNTSLDVTALETNIDGNSHVDFDYIYGYDKKLQMLTAPQKAFVLSAGNGAERLEGAAGTGKTITLVLRCIRLLKENSANDTEYHIIFFTHSKAVLEHINELFAENYEEFREHIEDKSNRPKVSIFITTLQDWCSWQLLGINHIEDTEFIDKDASYSKQLQNEYIREACEQTLQKYDSAFLYKLCSKAFLDFIMSPITDNKLDTMRHEIAVYIKGKAKGNIDAYKSFPYNKSDGYPIQQESDRTIMYAIYKSYQDLLRLAHKYDTDDIVISAYRSISTPILERKREVTGYDLCVIDETQLFNLNELSIFHYTNKPDLRNRIIYAIDKSQAIGDWGISKTDLDEFFGTSDVDSRRYNTVFRSSPDIVNLAFGVLSSGATLFTSFENPMDLASTTITPLEEKKCLPPAYLLCKDDFDIIETAIERAEAYVREKKGKRHKILFCSTTNELHQSLCNYASKANKSFEVLLSRSDMNAVKKAELGGKFVFGEIDYVGGLEFDMVIILGVDKGRVPTEDETIQIAQNYINYAWHNRMYVAITRAKYAVLLLGNMQRDSSPMLKGIIDAEPK